jgi:hypothetical protein
MLLTEFGFSPYKNSRVERLQMWRQYLNEMRATDTRVCVLVETAETLQLDVLAALESLTAADPNGCPGANVVLTTRTGMTDLLAEPALASLRQRTRLRWNLEPLTRVELHDYLVHCIKSAGGKTLKLFTDEAIDALHQYSAGIIRAANNLCATALTLAASAREPQVSAALINQVAVDVFGLAPAPGPVETPWPMVAPAEPKVARAEAKVAQTPAPAAPAPPPYAAPRAATPPLSAPRAATPPPATPAPVTPVTKAAVPPPTFASTPAPPPAPAKGPSMPPSHALAARVAATRAAQAAAPPPPRPVPATKPATAASTAGAKPTTVQAPAPAAPPPAVTPPTAAQAPATPKSMPKTPPPAAFGERTAPARAPTPAPMAERHAPAATTKPKSPPVMASTAAPPSSSGAKPGADVPVLTVEFESSPEVANEEEEFSFDLALSAGQIDAVLAKDLSDVPVLTEPIESAGEAPSADDSMVMQFDEETQHKLANLEALANAKALEEISNSMAETLFGDEELDKLAATLALATGKRDDDSTDDEPQQPAKARTAP